MQNFGIYVQDLCYSARRLVGLVSRMDSIAKMIMRNYDTNFEKSKNQTNPNTQGTISDDEYKTAKRKLFSSREIFLSVFKKYVTMPKKEFTEYILNSEFKSLIIKQNYFFSTGTVQKQKDVFKITPNECGLVRWRKKGELYPILLDDKTNT